MAFNRRKTRRAAAGMATALLAAAFVLIAAMGIVRFNRSLRTQQLAAVRQSVQNAVAHCYSLEGAYPADLDYLAENYGLVLDRAHYIYDYSVFASNMPPEIQIFRKK